MYFDYYQHKVHRICHELNTQVQFSNSNTQVRIHIVI